MGERAARAASVARNAWSAPGRLTTYFVLVGIVWISAVDGIPLLCGEHRERLQFVLILNLLFVLVSACLFFLLIHRATRSERRYMSFIHYYPDGICSFDKRGKFVESNPAFERITGFSLQELMQDGADESVINKDDKERLKNLIRSVRDDHLDVARHVPETEVTLTVANGRRLRVYVTLVPLVHDLRKTRSHTDGWFVVFKDVTELRQSEEKLRQLEKLTAVGELAAGVAHEIRNPLTALKGFLQMFLETRHTEWQRYVQIMKGEIDRIDAIVGELLTLSRPKQALRCKIDLKDLVQTTLMFLNAQAIIQNVVIESDMHIDTTIVSGDEYQLKQVFVNLIKNGIEAMPDGGQLSVRMVVDQTDAIRTTVEDEGIGMDPTLLGKIGQAFVTTKDTGTGLGLLVTQRIVQQHGGTLKIASEQGKGTRVTVTLPVA